MLINSYIHNNPKLSNSIIFTSKIRKQTERIYICYKKLPVSEKARKKLGDSYLWKERQHHFFVKGRHEWHVSWEIQCSILCGFSKKIRHVINLIKLENYKTSKSNCFGLVFWN